MVTDEGKEQIKPYNSNLKGGKLEKELVDSGVGSLSTSPSNEVNDTPVNFHHRHFYSGKTLVSELSVLASDFILHFDNLKFEPVELELVNWEGNLVQVVEMNSVYSKLSLFYTLPKSSRINLILNEGTLNLLVPSLNSNQFEGRGLVLNTYLDLNNFEHQVYFGSEVVVLKSNTLQQVYDQFWIANMLASKLKFKVVHLIDSTILNVETNGIVKLDVAKVEQLFLTPIEGQGSVEQVYAVYSKLVEREVSNYQVRSNPNSEVLVVTDVQLEVQSYNLIHLNQLDYDLTLLLKTQFKSITEILVVQDQLTFNLYSKLISHLLQLKLKIKVHLINIHQNVDQNISKLEEHVNSIRCLSYTSDYFELKPNLSKCTGLDIPSSFKDSIDPFQSKPIVLTQLYHPHLLNCMFVEDLKLVNLNLNFDSLDVLVINTNQRRLNLHPKLLNNLKLKVYKLDWSQLEKYSKPELTWNLILTVHANQQQTLSLVGNPELMEKLQTSLELVDVQSKSVQLVEAKLKSVHFVNNQLPIAKFESELSQVDRLALQLLFKPNLQSQVQLRPERSQTYQIQVSKKIRLTPQTYDRNIFHIEFDLTNSNLKYEVGDALTVYGLNDKLLVHQLLKDLKLDGNQLVPVDLDGKLQLRTLSQIFIQNLDLFGRPTKDFYHYLQNHVYDSKHRKELNHLTSKNGSFSLKQRVEGYTNYADLLLEFNSLKLDSENNLLGLIASIPLIKPRHYSIASAQSYHPNSVHLLIVTVNWVTNQNVLRQGQCTHYLDHLQVGDSVLVGVKPSVMKLPTDPLEPIVMAGLGTGMAPFKAFLEHRIHQQQQGIKIGPIILYFGARKREEEYLYGETWDKYKDLGIVTHLGLAFSRDQKEKVYIQHKIQKDSQLIFEHLLKNKGTFYLCGPTWPELDVRMAIANAFKREFKDLDLALEHVEKLKEKEKYVLELY